MGLATVRAAAFAVVVLFCSMRSPDSLGDGPGLTRSELQALTLARSGGMSAATAAASPAPLVLDERAARLRISLVTAVSGSISPAFAGARYSEVVRRVEAYQQRGERADDYSRSLYCMSLQQIGRWGDAGDCLGQLDASLRRRIDAGRSDGCGLFGVCIDIGLAVATAQMGRARQALAVGDLEAGLAQATAAVAAAGHTGAFNRGGLPWAMSQQALALALTGRPAEALDAAARTREVLGATWSLARSGVADDTWQNLASAYLALGRGDLAWEMAGQIGADKALGRTIIATGAIGTFALASLGGPALIAALGTAEVAREGVAYDAMWARAGELRRAAITALAATQAGDLSAARPLLDALLSDPLVQAMAQLHPALLEARGRVARADGDSDGALARYQQAVDSVETTRGAFRDEAGRLGFVHDKQALYLELVDLLVEQGRAADALQIAERAKGRAFVDLMGTRLDVPALAAAAADGSAVRDLQQAMDAADRFNPALVGEPRRRTIEEIRRRRDALAAQRPALLALTSVAVPGTATLLASLDPDETLLEYYGAGQRWFAFVARRGAVQAVRLAPTALEARVREYRALIEDVDDEQAESGAALAADLLALVAPLLVDERITVVPHGILHYLPWAALPLDGSGELLMIDRHELRILPSLAVLPMLNGNARTRGQPARGEDASMLALGNPDLRDARLDLPGAQSEVSAIAATEQGVVLRLRGDASETLLKREARGYRRLHLASHGVFDGGRPLRSGLLLAASAEDDGRLTVAETYGLELDADLVTLSACETGLGGLTAGDDILGLTRGFLFAGASSVVASLWQVSDATTATLMVDFYAVPAAGQASGRAAALRRAQLAVRSAGFRHPFYWAPFQLTGMVR